MSSNRRAFDAVRNITKKTDPIGGKLGIPINGVRLVDVPRRPGFVYVRLRDNDSELIQAFNDKVSPVYDLPVLVEFKRNRYEVTGRDAARYQNWGTASSYVPAHGAQHSLLVNQGGGADPVWVDGRQMMPGAIYPSGTLGGPNVILSEFVFKNKLGNWTYAGNTGTPNLTAARPSGSDARLMLICLDYTSGGFVIKTGSVFSGSLTGTSQIWPYLPSTSLEEIPISAVRLTSGTTQIGWDNIYDMRQWIDSGFITGSSGAGVPALAGDKLVLTDSSGDLTTQDWITYKNSQKQIVIGTTGVPLDGGTALHIFDTLGHTGGEIFLWGQGTGSVVGSDWDGKEYSGRVFGMRSRGSVAVPQGIQRDDVILDVAGVGYMQSSDGGADSMTPEERDVGEPGIPGVRNIEHGMPVLMRFVADGPFILATGTSYNARPTRVEFWTTPTGAFPGNIPTGTNSFTIRPWNVNIPTGSTYNINGVPHTHAGIDFDVIINGEFDTDTDWTKGAGWTISGGKAQATAAIGFLYPISSPFVIGRSYRLRFTLDSITAGELGAYAGGFQIGPYSVAGTYDFSFVATDTGLSFDTYDYPELLSAVIDNVSAIETQDLSNYAVLDAENHFTVGQRFDGTFDQDTASQGLYAGVVDSTPRLLFANGNPAQNWQLDVYNGNFRWYLPGVEHMILSTGSLTLPNKVVIADSFAASNVPGGVEPYATDSSQLNINLNAEFLNGHPYTDFLIGGITGSFDSSMLFPATEQYKYLVSGPAPFYYAESHGRLIIATGTTLTVTTSLTNNGGAGVLTWPGAGATLTIPATGTPLLATGLAGGQTGYGGTAANESLRLHGTLHATKTTSYLTLQEAGGNFGVGTPTPGWLGHFEKSSSSASSVAFACVTVVNSLVTQGDDISTWNVAEFKVRAGNGTVTGGLWASYGGLVGTQVGSATNHDTNLVVSDVPKVTVKYPTGFVGLLTTSPTHILSASGEAARSFWLERRIVDGVGSALTVEAGGAFSTGTNRAGGNLILKSGVATGTGRSEIQLWTVIPGSTGSSDNVATQLAVFTGNQRFGVNVASPGTIGDFGGQALRIGGDTSNFLLRTNSTAKAGFLTVPHYTSAEEDFSTIFGSSGSADNEVAFGGGSSSFNAATKISLWTAANNTTVTGTQRLLVNSAGSVMIGTATDGMTAAGSLAIAKDLAHRGTLAGFYNAALVVQQLAATDPIVALSNLGLRVAGTAWPLTTTGLVTLARLFRSGGTAIAVGDVALGAGWGAGATVTAVSGNDSRGTITVTTSALDTPLAAPVLTLTFKDGTWTTVPFATANLSDSSTGTLASTAPHCTATTLVITYIGTPTALLARTYIFIYQVVG